MKGDPKHEKPISYVDALSMFDLLPWTAHTYAHPLKLLQSGTNVQIPLNSQGNTSEQ